MFPRPRRMSKRGTDHQILGPEASLDMCVCVSGFVFQKLDFGTFVELQRLDVCQDLILAYASLCNDLTSARKGCMNNV